MFTFIFFLNEPSFAGTGCAWINQHGFCSSWFVITNVNDFHNRHMSDGKTVRWLNVLFLTCPIKTCFWLDWRNYNFNIGLSFFLTTKVLCPVFLSRQLYETLFLTRDLIKVVLVVLRDFPVLFLTRRYSAHYYCLLDDNNSRQTVALESRPWARCCISKVNTFSLYDEHRQPTYISYKLFLL